MPIWLEQRRAEQLPAEETQVAGGIPTWFSVGLLSVGSVLLSGGVVGLVLAFFGWYRGWLVLPLAALGAIALIALARPRSFAGPAARSAHWAAIGLVVLVGGSIAVNVAFDSSHVEVNRDPGVYAVTGKWIATHGSLQVPADSEWAASGVPVELGSLGTYAQKSGGVQFQFDHFVPVLLAEADGIGGDSLLFAMPAVLGGLALAAIYAAGCLLLRRPGLVLAAVAGLALSLPQVNVARDTYSEAGTQLLLWIGLWLLARWISTRQPRMALLAGLFLGSTVMTRIDAVVYLVPLPILAALLWLAEDREANRGLRPQLIALGAGVVPGLALGTIDLLLRSRGYFDLLRGQLISLWVALGVAVILAAGLIALAGRVQKLVAVVPPGRAAPLAGVLITVWLAAMWLLRPHLQTTQGSKYYDIVSGLQQAERQPVNGYRDYAEHSVTWMAWYLGPVAILLACAGLGLLVRAACAGRRPETLVVLGTLSLSTLLYLWQPSITPDQIWATRRFVPAIMPLLALCAAAGIGAAAAVLLRRTRSRALPVAVTVVLVALVVIGPARVTVKVGKFSAQNGYDGVIDAVCRRIGPSAAVVFQPGGRLELTSLPAVRSWCGAPAAVLPADVSPAGLIALARSWRAGGRQLWVLSASDTAIRVVEPSAAVELLGTATSKRELAQTIARTPYKYDSETLSIYGAAVASS